MPNKNYVKGRRKEYKLKKELEEDGEIVLRTAGSHGFADLISIDKKNRLIRFIQVKSGNYREKYLEELEESMDFFLNKNGKLNLKLYSQLP